MFIRVRSVWYPVDAIEHVKEDHGKCIVILAAGMEKITLEGEAAQVTLGDVRRLSGLPVQEAQQRQRPEKAQHGGGAVPK